MRVKIEFTVDIEPESWTMNFGIEGPAAIRKDVKEYAEQTVYGQLANSGIEPYAST